MLESVMPGCVPNRQFAGLLVFTEKVTSAVFRGSIGGGETSVTERALEAELCELLATTGAGGEGGIPEALENGAEG